MKNKKRTLTLLSGMLLIGALTSCGGTTPASSQVVSAPEESSSFDFTVKYTEIDSIDIDSGDYMANDVIYSIDKSNKTVKAASYADYEAYQNKQGQVLFETSIRFVTVIPPLTASYNAIYFENADSVYLLFREDGKLRLSVTASGMVGSQGVVAIADIATFSYGNYVSNLQTQHKADENGNYVYDSKGNYVDEEFYLFLELTATKAAIYVGQDSTTHAETPLHSVENYKILFLNGRLVIRVPHANGSLHCSLTAISDTTIRFLDSTERRGDYSGSGTFTKVD